MVDSAVEKTGVFLSYARADDDPNYDDAAKSFLRRLYNALTAAGFRVWWDRESLPARGESFTREIENAIRGCERFILVVGPGAVASDYVRQEWMFALGDCKPVMPILRKENYSIIPAEMADTNAIDCRESRDEAAALRDIINRLSEDVPLGVIHNVRALPKGHITREKPFKLAQDALRADAINPTVISAPTSATAVYGVGGVGKSTLAAALAHDCAIRRSFPDGVIWLEIGQTPDVHIRLADIGAAFGDGREHYIGEGKDEQSAKLRLSWILSDKKALIVLDDVWDHRVVERFPIHETPCRLLITTRNRELAKIVEAADVSLEMLSDEEGASLIAILVESKRDDVFIQITSALGGHTLAIVLAAARLKKRGIAYAQAILDGLNDTRNPFANLNVSKEDKNLNLEKSLALSYHALEDDLKRRFRALGILALDSIFTLDMIANIWGDATSESADHPLEELIDAGLVELTSQEGYYSQHRLLRAYACALLNEAGELDDVCNRYADVVTEQAVSFDILSPKEWWRLDPLLPHIRAVGDELVQQWNATLLPNDALIARAEQFAYNIVNYVSYRPQMVDTPKGRERLGLRWLEIGLAASHQISNQQREALYCNQIGIVWLESGDQWKALDYFEQALLLAQAMGEQRIEAVTVSNIGNVWDRLGKKRKALGYYEQALSLFQVIDDQDGQARTLNNIGAAWHGLDKKRKALGYYEQALSLFQIIDNQDGEAATLNNIGHVWDGLGKKDKALGYYEQALSLFRSLHDQRSEATTLNNIATIYLKNDNFGKAANTFQEIIVIVHTMGAVAQEALYRANLAATLNAMNKKVAAIVELEHALTILQQHNMSHAPSGESVELYEAILRMWRDET